MEKTFIEMKLFQVKPDRHEQFEAKIEEMSANQLQFNNSKTLAFHPEKLEKFEDAAAEFDGGEKLKGIVRVFKAKNCTLYHDISNEHLLITI